MSGSWGCDALCDRDPPLRLLLSSMHIREGPSSYSVAVSGACVTCSLPLVYHLRCVWRRLSVCLGAFDELHVQRARAAAAAAAVINRTPSAQSFSQQQLQSLRYTSKKNKTIDRTQNSHTQQANRTDGVHSLCRQNSPETLPLKLQSLLVTNASASIRLRCFYTKHFLRRKARSFPLNAKQQAFIVQPAKRLPIRYWTFFRLDRSYDDVTASRRHRRRRAAAPSGCGVLRRGNEQSCPAGRPTG